MPARRRTTVGRLAAGLVAVGLAVTACGSSGGGSGSATGDTAGSASTTGGAAVSKDSITVGNVAVLSGPIPGLFQGAPYGVEAYFAMVNSKGGVNGRKLEVTSADDALNCNENSKQTKALASKVFAFVGNFSIFDDCGAAVLAKAPTVPDVAYPLGDKTKQLPNNYSPQPAPPGFRLGGFTYYKDTFGVSKLGSIIGQGNAEYNFKQQSAAAASVGIKTVYSRTAASTETNFTSDVLRMKNDGVDYLYLTDFDVRGITRLLQAAKQQNWKPKLISASPVYDAHFFQLLGDPSAAEGVMIDQPFAMFLGEDAATTPGVADFDTWMKKTHPDFQPDLFSMYGWASAALFVDALQKAGPEPTQQKVLDALAGIHSFDADGLLAPADVGNRKAPECAVFIRIHDGKYQRVKPADKGYACQPGGYFDYKG